MTDGDGDLDGCAVEIFVGGDVMEVDAPPTPLFVPFMGDVREDSGVEAEVEVVEEVVLVNVLFLTLIFLGDLGPDIIAVVAVKLFVAVVVTVVFVAPPTGEGESDFFVLAPIIAFVFV